MTCMLFSLEFQGKQGIADSAARGGEYPHSSLHVLLALIFQGFVVYWGSVLACVLAFLANNAP